MGGHIDLSDKENKINEIKKELSKEDIWNNIEYANGLNKTLSELEKSIKEYNELNNEVVENLELIHIADEEMINEIGVSIGLLEEKFEKLKITSLLDGEYDSSNCYLEIHPGAGGTEACDWASMLLRMYTMFCEKNGYTYKVIESLKGEEAGIKSVTILISGYYP